MRAHDVVIWWPAFAAVTDAAARTKLVALNEKLSNLERQMEVLEAHMSTAMNSSDQF